MELIASFQLQHLMVVLDEAFQRLDVATKGAVVDVAPPILVWFIHGEIWRESIVANKWSVNMRMIIVFYSTLRSLREFKSTIRLYIRSAYKTVNLVINTRGAMRKRIREKNCARINRN